jgi:hypothetical protein
MYSVYCAVRTGSPYSGFFFSPQTDSFRFAFNPVAMLVTSPVSELPSLPRVMHVFVLPSCDKAQHTLRQSFLFNRSIRPYYLICVQPSHSGRNNHLHCFNITLQFQAYFATLSHKVHDFLKEKKVTERKMCKIKIKIQVPSSHTISYVFPQYISGNTTIILTL